MNFINRITILGSFTVLLLACQPRIKSAEFTGKDGEVKLLLLDPGHFHADLLQKTSNARINDSVYVYAPQGTELTQHMQRIASYNQHPQHPTSWKESVYSKEDFFPRMLSEKKGNVVVLAGNNQKKTAYIHQSVLAGFNVLADKPMAINKEQFELLKQSFAIAREKGVLLYDLMTERYDILNIIERELISNNELFGELEQGTQAQPAVYVESVHHFYKNVSGNPLIRPAWYYDVEQQGEGIVDVTTHLIDIVNWQCFPDVALDYNRDVSLQSARHWTTDLSLKQFSLSTQLNSFPEYLTKYVSGSLLKVYANGEIQYRIKGVNIALKVIWNFEAPSGSGDTYSSVIKGSRATCMILQNKEQAFVPQLYIRKAAKANQKTFDKALDKEIRQLQQIYPFISLKKEGDKIRIDIPVDKREGHEEHFSRVAEKYFDFLIKGNMPGWEIANMLTKYYITSTAFELANSFK
ncbi:MAG: putative oxidoreductase C-terminal domain-containing protein [Paludibacter sp.]|nr:putative oxidoreductase C-terminal domain-containing protein [Paludibacter sp.]MDD4199351.1 putative oxidoreductase C-terminal domain-containing protein [Paludibacter sp.]MDD4427802.1 putative oxidoreductase C-terminal domain-containing protein [Paludibacter sp.]